VVIDHQFKKKYQTFIGLFSQSMGTSALFVFLFSPDNVDVDIAVNFNKAQSRQPWRNSVKQVVYFTGWPLQLPAFSNFFLKSFFTFSFHPFHFKFPD
jgi:hypothetical protein